MKKIAILICFFFEVGFSSAQLETSKWYFGNGCGVDFAQNPPVAISSTVFNSLEGGASMSDANGSLLFYTDANTVWNQNHQTMANGSGIWGGQSSTQSSIIIQQPGSNSIYYIFTQESQGQPNGFRYNIVDMTLAAGLGSVTAKNVLLFTPSCEKLTAVKHCNGIDFWILTYDINNQNFRNYLLTASGVNTVPVITTIGSVPTTVNTIGQLRVSPNGLRLASAAFSDSKVELYDFNPTTGVVSNLMILTHSAMINPYAIEFSPDGTKLYASTYTSKKIIQWNLCLGNLAATLASAYILDATAAATAISSIQMAPNGKIYINHNYANMLSVINNPNGTQAACSFSLLSQACGGTTNLGLPNFMCSWFKNLGTQISFTQACTNATFEVPTNFQNCAAAISYTGQTWNFGDPGSGSQNTSTANLVAHTYASPGSYTATLFMHSTCGTDSLKKIVSVTSNTILIVGADSVCAGNSIILSANGSGTYTWSTGQNSSTVVISPSVTTSYSIVNIASPGCDPTSTQHFVKVYGTSILNVVGPSTICLGDSAIYFAAGASSFSWSNGQTSYSTTVAPITNSIYSVVGTYTNGCLQVTKTFSLSVIPLPALAISGNTTACLGEYILLYVTGANTYTWSNGNNSGTFSIAINSNTVTQVVGSDISGCKDSLVINLKIDECLGWKTYSAENNNATIFPNPTKNQITLTHIEKFTSCSVYTTQGEKIGVYAINSSNNQIIDISQLDAGIYVLELLNESERKQMKLIVGN